MQNKILRTTENFSKCTLVRDLHKYLTKLCGQQAEVTQNHENVHVRSTGQGEARE
jgi:hypothetical protein